GGSPALAQPSEVLDRSGDGSVDGSDVGHVTCRPQGPLAETVGDFPPARIDIGHYNRPAPFDDQGRRGGADAAGGASDEVGAIREHHHVGWLETPPSTTRSMPVIQRARSDARKTQASPTSLGVPRRPSGAAAFQRSTPSGHWSSMPSRWMSPGETELTRIPRPPHSRLAARACILRAAFDTE